MKLLSSIMRFFEKWLMTPSVENYGTVLCDFERIRHEIRSCDVLLIEGRSRVAKIIGYLTKSNWTHSALYLGRIYDIEDPKVRESIRHYFKAEDDEQLILESELGLGTVVRPLKTYKKEHVRICRPNGLSHTDGQQILSYAVAQLGKKYHARQVFDLMRFFLPYKILPSKLGSTLFNSNPGYAMKTVCSGLIAEAFSYVQFPILPLVKMTGANNEIQLFHRNPKLCTPKDFDYSPYFQIIKYPFFERNVQSSYRLLPWSGCNDLHASEGDLYMTLEQLRELHQVSMKKPAANENSKPIANKIFPFYYQKKDRLFLKKNKKI